MFHWFLQLESTFKNPSTPLPSGNLAIINPHLEYVYLVNYLRFLGDSMASHMGVDKPRYRLFGWSCIYTHYIYIHLHHNYPHCMYPHGIPVVSPNDGVPIDVPLRRYISTA